MNAKALRALSLAADLPVNGARSGTVDIETMWGWHYLIETKDGVRVRLICRVTIRGTQTQAWPADFTLPEEEGSGFAPTLRELGIRQDPPKRYRCTVLLEMPADDGQAMTPAEIVEWLNEHDVVMVDWIDKDIVPAEERTTSG